MHVEKLAFFQFILYQQTMIADIAYIALITALFSAGVTIAMGVLSEHKNICIKTTQIQFVCLTIAFGLLMLLFVQDDFSTLSVYQNSHSLQPLIYKITAVWGNHEGSLLLWVWVLSLFATLYPYIAKTDDSMTIKLLIVQSLIIAGFLILLIYTSNPFTTIVPSPQEGQSLNPLLQDPGLVIHPPLLYIGYVGLSVNFSLAVATLWQGVMTKDILRTMRKFALLAWCFLTAGIGLGSWWAYYELGWGGFWFWDPVENASFIPWLVTTALVHSLIVTEKRGALKQWSLLLSLAAFSLSLLGTFLVRSGILTSVHAFASDPVRGLFILLLLTVALAGAYLLFALRGHKFTDDKGEGGGGGFSPMSREGGILLNNFLLTASAGVVLIGTLFPLFVELFGGGKMTVGAPYFNISWTPLAYAALLLMAVMPLLAWGKGNIKKSLRILLPAYIIMVGAFFILLFFYEKLSAVLVLAFAIFLLASVTVGFFRQRRLQVGKKIWQAGAGMSLAHFGVGLLLFGVGGVSLLSYDKAYNVMVGEKIEFRNYEVELRSVQAGTEKNYLFLRADLFFSEAEGGRWGGWGGWGGFPFRLHPERRLYFGSGQTTTEAAIRSSLLGDYYATIAERGAEIAEGAEGEGRSYILHLHYKPFAIILWIAVSVIVFGGCVSLFSNFKKGRYNAL